MNKTLITIFVSFLGLLTITSVFLGVFQPWNEDEMDIEFSHDQLKAYPGQTTWLLAKVRLDSETFNPSSGAITISTNHLINYDYHFWTKSDYRVVEIFLYPNETHLGLSISVTISLLKNNELTNKSASVSVVDWTSSYTIEAQQMLQRFTDYLLANCTSYNSAENDSLEFLGNAPQILIVEHYLFRTLNWEIELSRHVMISPDDWVQIYLRSRDSMQPVWAGKIYSWGSGNHTIFEIDPPETIFR